jgi:hypothetical protein
MLNNMKLNRARYEQGKANIQDVAGMLGNPTAGGGAGGIMGARPASDIAPAPTNVKQIGSPSDLMDYKSKYPEFDEPQLQQESGGNPSAVSAKGAQGAMQMMPETAREREAMWGLPNGYTAGSGALNVQANIKAGRQYRDELIDKYIQQTGNEQTGKLMGLAAYNWGPGNFDKWLAAGAPPDKLPKETRDYVAKIAGGAPKASTGAPRMPKSGMMPALPTVTGAPVATRNSLPNGSVNKYLYKG